MAPKITTSLWSSDITTWPAGLRIVAEQIGMDHLIQHAQRMSFANDLTIEFAFASVLRMAVLGRIAPWHIVQHVDAVLRSPVCRTARA